MEKHKNQREHMSHLKEPRQSLAKLRVVLIYFLKTKKDWEDPGGIM